LWLECYPIDGKRKKRSNDKMKKEFKEDNTGVYVIPFNLIMNGPSLLQNGMKVKDRKMNPHSWRYTLYYCLLETRMKDENKDRL